MNHEKSLGATPFCFDCLADGFSQRFAAFPPLPDHIINHVRDLFVRLELNRQSCQ